MSYTDCWMPERKHYVLWGSGGHAKVLDEAIRQRGDQVIALFDNSPSAKPALEDVKLIGGIDDFEPWIKRIVNKANLCGLVAIGGERGQDRRIIQNFFSQPGVSTPPLIHQKIFHCRYSHPWAWLPSPRICSSRC